MLCGVKFFDVWDSMGDAEGGCLFTFAWRNCLGKQFSNIWNMVLACLMWLIWWEHNTCTFEDFERPLDLLKSLLVGTLFEWSFIRGYTRCTSIFEFLESVSVSF